MVAVAIQDTQKVEAKRATKIVSSRIRKNDTRLSVVISYMQCAVCVGSVLLMYPSKT